jgi:hypothetical protein
MNTALVKPSKMLKGSFSAVGELQDALSRAWDIYQKAIKREEASYFERVKRVMADYADEAAPEEAAAPAPTNSQTETVAAA